MARFLLNAGAADTIYCERSMKRLVLIMTLLALGACADLTEPGLQRSAGSNRLAGPIETLRCDVDEPFVRTGGVARVRVDARDRQGVVSSAYEVVVTPASGARVVQRTKVIFDVAGDYTIACRSLDTDVTDVLAVGVGSIAPALAVSVPEYTEFRTVRLAGRAHSARFGAVAVKVGDQSVVPAEDGSFAVDLNVVPGLNRFDVTATDATGRATTRLAWTLAGKFGDAGAESSDAVIIGLRPASFAKIETVLEDVIGKTLRTPEVQAGMLKSSSGSRFGTKWEYHPTQVQMGRLSVDLTARRDGVEVQLIVPSVRIDGWARTRIFRWKQRDVEVTAQQVVVNTILTTGPGGRVILRGTRAQIDGADVEISGLPGFIENIILNSMEGDVANSIRASVDQEAADAVNELVGGFGDERDVVLPAPLKGELLLDTRVSNVWANHSGLQVGLGVTVASDTLPRFAHAPGPWRPAGRSPRLAASAAPYQAAVGEDALNALLFAAWSTGAFELEVDAESALGEIQHVDAVWVWVDPILPPTLEATDTPGVLELRAGAVRIDVVVESDLGVVNGAFMAEATGKVSISAQGRELTTAVELTDLHIDMLIAPAGLETEAIEALVVHALGDRALTDIASVTHVLEVPETDLSKLGLPGKSTLSLHGLEVLAPAEGAALDLAGDVVLE
jgi:hypothetical protein